MRRLLPLIFLIFLVTFTPASAITPTPERSIKLGTMDIPTATFPPTVPPEPTSLPTTPSPTPLTPTGFISTPIPTLPGSTPQAPVSGKQYCVDEEPGSVMIESCDDRTRCDIAHGGGGPQSTCGTVISWTHNIMEYLLSSTGEFVNKLSDNLSSPITSSCYTASPYSPYISTFNVIDSYNLAGFHEFSRGTHADSTALTNTWKTTSGYTASTTSNGLTPGDAVLFSNPPHVGIVNTVEVDSRGNGDIWFLHTGATYYLGKLMVANYQVVASSTGDKNVIFGSNQSKSADATIGETVCYCGSICYQWKFN